MRKLLGCVCAAALLATGSSAHAAWYEASSRHFVIYADSNPKQLQAFATRLEKFDQAVRAVMHYDDPQLGDGNRLTVFVLSNMGAVQKMMGTKATDLAGFYQPRAAGSLAFVPKSTPGQWQGDMSADTVFFHEYSHHVMLQDLDRPYPIWLVEGFAEFMETAQLGKDGSVVLGAPPAFRAGALMWGVPIPLQQLLTGSYDKLTPAQRDVFYGEGWLLTHYLYMGGTRSGQLAKYLNLLNSGTPPLEAAPQAFGDLGQLQKDLNTYKNQHSVMGMKIGADRTQPGPIEVKPLSDGGAAVILLRANLKHGVDKSAAEALAAQVRAVETRFAGDELVEVTLAEAEIGAGHADAAEAAADRVLKADPKNVEAMIFKGQVAAARGWKSQGAQRRQLFDQARGLFVAANKIDTEDPEPLYEFYKSYLVEGVRPNDNAIAAMHYASDLVPQDFGLRVNSAIAFLNEGKTKEARMALAAVAYSPHAGELAQTAKNMIAAIDSGDAKSALTAARAGPTQQSKAH